MEVAVTVCVGQRCWSPRKSPAEHRSARLAKAANRTADHVGHQRDNAFQSQLLWRSRRRPTNLSSWAALRYCRLVAIHEPATAWELRRDRGPWTFLFRQIPSMTIIINWAFEATNELFATQAFSLAGNVIGQFDYVMHPGRKVTSEELEKDARDYALDKGLLRSKNQTIKMYLQNTTFECKGGDAIWSHDAASAPPSRRLVRKTNLAKLRLRRRLTTMARGLPP